MGGGGGVGGVSGGGGQPPMQSQQQRNFRKGESKAPASGTLDKTLCGIIYIWGSIWD